MQNVQALFPTAASGVDLMSSDPSRPSDASHPQDGASLAPLNGERALDQALVERTQAGDKRAYELLVVKYQRRVARLIGRWVRDAGEVEDLTQDTFIRAYRAIGGFRSDSAFYTWLYRIAVNTAKNFLVTRGRRPPSSTEMDAEEAEQTEAGIHLREVATPESEMMSRQVAQTVQRAMNALPEDLRLAISLREIEGLSYEDIALTMDCPIGTVRSRIFRAREAISLELKPLLGDRGDKRW